MPKKSKPPLTAQVILKRLRHYLREVEQFIADTESWRDNGTGSQAERDSIAARFLHGMPELRDRYRSYVNCLEESVAVLDKAAAEATQPKG